MKRTVHPVLRLAVTVVGMLWCGLQTAQSLDRVFANPPMLSSRDGRLDVDLIASPGEYTINGYQFQGMLYNGAYVPPVWRIRLGDILTVTVHNRLSKPTNLHFHGLGVSPLGNGDNVFLHVKPGETFIEYLVIDEEARLVRAYRERKSAPMCDRTRPHDIDVERFIHVLRADHGLGRCNICRRSC